MWAVFDKLLGNITVSAYILYHSGRKKDRRRIILSSMLEMLTTWETSCMMTSLK